MLQRAERRNQCFPASRPYRATEPQKSSCTINKVLDSYLERESIPADVQHGLRQKQPRADRLPSVQTGTKADKTACVNRAFERLSTERSVLTSAGPSQWFQRSIDRVEGGLELASLMLAYLTTALDVEQIERELLHHPRHLQTANRWMFRLSTSDMDHAMMRICDMALTKAQAERDGIALIKPTVGPVEFAALRLTQASAANVAMIDLGYKNLTDEHLARLLTLMQRFTKMVRLDLSNNEITDASMIALVDTVMSYPHLVAVDLQQNPITEAGIAGFNARSMVQGAGWTLNAQLHATKTDTWPQAAATVDLLMAREAAVFEHEFVLPLRVACERAKTGGQVLRAMADDPGLLRRVRHLDLSGKTWQAIDLCEFESICKNEGYRLTYLDFSRSTLPKNGVVSLIRALAHTPQLQILRLSGVPVDAAADAALRELVQRTATLRHIACDAAPLTDAALLARSDFKPTSHASLAGDVPHGAAASFSEQSSNLVSRELAALCKQLTRALKYG